MSHRDIKAYTWQTTATCPACLPAYDQDCTQNKPKVINSNLIRLAHTHTEGSCGWQGYGIVLSDSQESVVVISKTADKRMKRGRREMGYGKLKDIQRGTRWMVAAEWKE